MILSLWSTRSAEYDARGPLAISSGPHVIFRYSDRAWLR